MDPITIILWVASALFSGTGIWSLLAARATARATKEAALTAAEAANKQATTADWSGLMTYWQNEVKELRSNTTALEVRLMFLEGQRDVDLQHIDMLEQHIWQQLPPPPPMRRTRPTHEGPSTGPLPYTPRP